MISSASSNWAGLLSTLARINTFSGAMLAIGMGFSWPCRSSFSASRMHSVNFIAISRADLMYFFTAIDDCNEVSASKLISGFEDVTHCRKVYSRRCCGAFWSSCGGNSASNSNSRPWSLRYLESLIPLSKPVSSFISVSLRFGAVL